MNNSPKHQNDNSKIGASIGMLLGVCFGTIFNNVGIYMLIGFTLGLFYDEHQEKKRKK
ncbi:hypothetical protein [Clostridium saccharobutylicum]|uniref:Glycine zipper-like domain-containing protein n=1 Tax=Clostridium saccharobutylicum DSM 13864 TaxID=1345695 RepID=U5MLG1_CLOSA|nr:hypothetical protein [Clostridium saccharobutylicum]AGX41363.1 hypothetical protein CLSA_c03110 [Clostridium saccharobutylicum DSM 13864]AQR88646.1 hypothetical protein CLOSC_03080 [Clostridium saccharobutylicum]AQR98544.1 hypothetical protein CSACC_03080 [Clostridium saccharobutylicum]AQS08256.1 hypothetical protein CLOBY_03260 [Clostridium saccharobutylicum]AQS12534.1 hypothetical protein CLOSACC_03080 [Clostridium saccharobutylicum]